MSIAVGASAYTTGNYSGTPLTSAAQTTQASGSSFAVFCIGPASVTYTPTDSKGNTYTLQGTIQNNTSDGISIALYLATNGTGGTGFTFNMSMSVHATVFWYGVEITGGVTSALLDQFYGNTGFLGNPTPGPVTTISANELILAAFQNNQATLTSVTPGTGFTTLLSDFTNGSALVSQVVSSTGTYDPSITFAPTGGRSQIITGSFIAAGAGAPTLSAPTPSGTLGTATSATLGCTSTASAGTIYGVVDTAANISGITAAQIVAGQNKNSTSAAFSANASVSTLTPSVGITGLTSSTTYSYALAQANSGNSNVVTGTFTTGLSVIPLMGQICL